MAGSLMSVAQLDAERFFLAPLERLLPAHSLLECDCELRVVSLLCDQEAGGSIIVEQQQYSDQEFAVLLVLFEQYPDYAPQADLLAAQTGRSLQQCQREVQRALDDGLIDELIRPVRNVLSRARLKLRRFGMDIRSIQETGYMIVEDREVYRRR
jgi:hypothetical protein